MMLTTTRQARADAYRTEMLARIAAAAAQARSRHKQRPPATDLV